MAEATYSLFLQLCMVRDDRGWQRGLAARLRPNAAWPAGAASTQRDRGNLQSFLGFDPTGPGRLIYSLVDSFSRTGPRDAAQPRPNGTVPLRQRGSASSSQVRLYYFAQHAVTRCRCDYWITLQFRTRSA